MNDYNNYEEFDSNFEDITDIKIEKFNKFEKIFFRIELGILGVGIFLFTLFSIAIEALGGIADILITVILFSWLAIIVNFIISLVRIFKYLFNVEKFKEETSIWRSVITLFLSPALFGFFYILIIIATFTSCLAQQ